VAVWQQLELLVCVLNMIEALSEVTLSAELELSIHKGKYIAGEPNDYRVQFTNPKETIEIQDSNSVKLELEDSSFTMNNEEEDSIKVTWACNQQKGYKFNVTPDMEKSLFSEERTKLPLHPEIEDVHFPTISTPKQNYVSKHGDKLFIIADGHAGHQAPYYFIDGLSTRIMTLLNEKRYDFSDLEHQLEITNEITEMFTHLDKVYTQIKIDEFQQWLKMGSPVARKPMDDGCTMVVNILQKGWVLNCNVGDSRTVLARKSMYQSDWIPMFYSNDHNMSHPYKVADIHSRGGKFVDQTGKYILNPKIECPKIRGDKQYTELANTRLYRPLSDEIKKVGCSHRRTLNLTATCGDLLFKIEPAVLNCVPDFTFTKLEDSEYILIMATDGLWDHLYSGAVGHQNQAVINKISNMLQDDFSGSSLDSYETESQISLEDTLEFICRHVNDREALDNEIFVKNLQRYDDVTCMLIHIDSA
jgi:serine/threonine protein phosphatase PrpC